MEHYATAALGLAIVSFMLYLWNRNKNLPPGPRGLPLLGYYPFMSNAHHIDFTELAKRYGNVFSFRTVGGTLIIVLNGSKTIKEILVNRADEFVGRPREHNLIALVSDGLGITQEEGKPWKEQRKFFLQSVKNFGFGKLEMEEQIQDEIKLMLDDLRKTGAKPTEIAPHIQHTTSSVISHVMFNKRYKKDDPVFQAICKGFDALVQMFVQTSVICVGWFFRYFLMYFYSCGRKAQKGKSHLINEIDKIVEDHIRSFDKENTRDFIDAFLHHRSTLQRSGELEKSTFTIERLKAISLNMLMEGTESVASTICNMLMELSNHQDVQKKAQSEIDSVVGGERMTSWMDKPKLPYLDAVITELYRTSMAFNTTTFYSNFEETSIQGHRIPKRSILIGNLWSMHNDPDIFPNPSKFDPGRFIGSDGKKIKRDGPYPFGVGKRSCVGESLAQVEVFLIIASVIQNFTLYLPSDKERNTLKMVPR